MASGPVSDPANDGPDLYEAVVAYCERFDEASPVYQFQDQPAALARVLRAAIDRGQPVTEADLYAALGIEPPPADAVL